MVYELFECASYAIKRTFSAAFTRPWAAMPPESPPPPGLLPAHGLSVNYFQDDTFDVARK